MAKRDQRNGEHDAGSPAKLHDVFIEGRFVMERRTFLKSAGAVLAATGLAGIARPARADSLPVVRWRMTSSFPKYLDTVYGGAEFIAARVYRVTHGKFNIRVYPAGEIIPGLRVLDAVQSGEIESGQTVSLYNINRSKVFGFDSALPFGLNVRQQNAWMYYGGGLQLMREFYTKYNIYNIPCGNTGTQMGGWFRKEINSLADMQGLKMRITGFGGEMMTRLGVDARMLEAGEIYPALEQGAIDAAEWIGPYDDEKFGFYQVAPHYYYPGFWELSSMITLYVNMDEWNRLPQFYQDVLELACAEANVNMMADYDHKNPEAMRRLLANGVQVHPYPQDIVEAAHKASFDIYAEESRKDQDFNKIYSQWKPYRDLQYQWFGIAEKSFTGLEELG